ncbi:hypothetical protein SAMN05444344_2392 [Tenacibaculum mesophilum]|uniref:HEAT repeat domain-containing protein n=1 Tax=Tenacibaculum mesophilum TaxID=104268 RepID=A0ABM7CD57_9FLAO|nr:hypothetical protein [Tenacibaculum mesophilum]AZJ31655.1 hypothetical protein D6200_03355 [Tenacibaculum mesophilum]QFS26907.1 hypothetical protein F9Y86_00220 [Tenacibaculum mesophilum]SHG01972.1 hypothetical protein SAMN05444344_2392 [Tenacibaculum mesophilum]
MERKITQKLKQKAYQLLVDKIDIEVFESFLYKLVENNEFNSKDLLFDFININYKSNDYRRRLLNLIKDNSSEKELLSLEVYSLCLTLSRSNENEVVLSAINSLSGLNSQTEYQYDILFEFYMLNDNILGDGFYYYSLTNEQVIDRAKLFSEKVISKFNSFKENEDWYGFLNCEIEVKNDDKVLKQNNVIKEVKLDENKSLIRKSIDLFKQALGVD